MKRSPNLRREIIGCSGQKKSSSDPETAEYHLGAEGNQTTLD